MDGVPHRPILPSLPTLLSLNFVAVCGRFLSLWPSPGTSRFVVEEGERARERERERGGERDNRLRALGARSRATTHASHLPPLSSDDATCGGILTSLGGRCGRGTASRSTRWSSRASTAPSSPPRGRCVPQKTQNLFAFWANSRRWSASSHAFDGWTEQVEGWRRFDER